LLVEIKTGNVLYCSVTLRSVRANIVVVEEQ